MKSATTEHCRHFHYTHLLRLHQNHARGIRLFQLHFLRNRRPNLHEFHL
jgi:hypothetical protein